MPTNDSPAIERLLPVETWFTETDADGRRLLRFASMTANIGEGPLDIISGPNADRGASTEVSTSPTWQRIWSDSWNYSDRASGDFVFHAGHDHMHFDAFERYRLLDPDGTIVAESAKVSFCLRDSLRVSDAPPPTTGVFGPAGDCGEVQQAINPGYADHYHQFLPDQWIDITGVAAGDYLVEITVDPLGMIVETDESNNTARFPVAIGETDTNPDTNTGASAAHSATDSGD